MSIATSFFIIAPPSKSSSAPSYRSSRARSRGNPGEERLRLDGGDARCYATSSYGEATGARAHEELSAHPRAPSAPRVRSHGACRSPCGRTCEPLGEDGVSPTAPLGCAFAFGSDALRPLRLSARTLPVPLGDRGSDPTAPLSRPHGMDPSAAQRSPVADGARYPFPSTARAPRSARRRRVRPPA